MQGSLYPEKNGKSQTGLEIAKTCKVLASKVNKDVFAVQLTTLPYHIHIL